MARKNAQKLRQNETAIEVVELSILMYLDFGTESIVTFVYHTLFVRLLYNISVCIVSLN